MKHASRYLAFALFLIAFVSVAFGQGATPQAPQPGVARITFELNWPSSDPQSYTITVDSDGRASYRSQPHENGGSAAAEPYELTFKMTDANCERVFELAKTLNYFQGNLDYKGKLRVADTGKKTITYERDATRNSTVYNWSERKELMELTTMFQRMSMAFEFGRRMAYARRFDRLGVNDELKRLEQMYDQGEVLEIQAIAPVLQKVADDRGSMNMTRQRALRLLKVAEANK